MFKRLMNVFAVVIGALAAAMFAVGQDIAEDAEGEAVTLTLTATVNAKQIAYINGWLGVTVASGASGQNIALEVCEKVYQITLPAALSAVAVGNIVYVTLASVTGHTPQTAAYTLTPGAGKQALCRVVEVYGADSDGNYVVAALLMTRSTIVG